MAQIMAPPTRLGKASAAHHPAQHAGVRFVVGLLRSALQTVKAWRAVELSYPRRDRACMNLPPIARYPRGYSPSAAARWMLLSIIPSFHNNHSVLPLLTFFHDCAGHEQSPLLRFTPSSSDRGASIPLNDSSDPQPVRLRLGVIR